jgi:hypothetical protein
LKKPAYVVGIDRYVLAEELSLVDRIIQVAKATGPDGVLIDWGRVEKLVRVRASAP